MVKVKSSNIEGVIYNDQTNTLEVHFKNGNEYSYEAVPQDIYDALIHADSVGKYFHSNIKGKYKTTKLAKKDN